MLQTLNFFLKKLNKKWNKVFILILLRGKRYWIAKMQEQTYVIIKNCYYHVHNMSHFYEL